MGTKHDKLTNAELEEYVIRPSILRSLNELRKHGEPVRVLDWGCGRGALVAKLVEAGYDAFGLDIDAEPIANGREAFEARRLDADERLKCVNPAEPTPFEAGAFDAVVSDQVLEHVADLDSTAKEIARITADRGIGLHCFPARWRVVEPHLQLPFLHWLPKSRVRYVYLRLLVSKVPVWAELSARTPAERAETYFRYSVERTFYRPRAAITAAFRRSGLTASFVADLNPNRRLFRVARRVRGDAVVGRLLNEWKNTFGECRIETRRRVKV